jgi:hypothetical protein
MPALREEMLASNRLGRPAVLESALAYGEHLLPVVAA